MHIPSVFNQYNTTYQQFSTNMASTTETKKESCCDGRHHRHPTEEERRQREAEFKQEFLDEYRKRYGDELISAEQTWELFQVLEESWHAKMKERRHSGQHGSQSPRHHGSHSPKHHVSPRRHRGQHGSRSPHHGSQSPRHHGSHSSKRQGSPRHHFEEKRKQVLAELQQDFQNDFTVTHGTSKVNVDQAWALIQKVKKSKFEKWQAQREKHGHHQHHSPPANE